MTIIQAKTGAALLAASAAGAAGYICVRRSRYERDHFKTEDIHITSPKLRQERTLVFLSDLHDKEFGVRESRLLEAIGRIRPDAVLIGGDTMVAKAGMARLEVTEQLLRGLRELFGQEGVPVYYGNGNHEQRLQRETGQYGTLYQEFMQLLSAYGIHYLADSTACLGDDICISGLDLEPQHYRDLIPAPLSVDDVRRRLGPASSQRFQILLAHSPMFHKAYAGWGADLTLAGHFHGGTIRLPILGGVMTPQYQFFLPCCAGTFERSGRWMVVSRGLGTHSINIRLNNRPQLVAVHLHPEGEAARD